MPTKSTSDAVAISERVIVSFYSLPVWPVSLPQYMELGDQETPPDVLIRVKMDVGPDRVRPRFTTNVRKISGKVELTTAQVEIFETFYRTTIFYGLEEFRWVLPRSGGGVNYRFIEPPKIKSAMNVKNLYVVELKLEIVPYSA